jgi:hypothetical protein
VVATVATSTRGLKSVTDRERRVTIFVIEASGAAPITIMDCIRLPNGPQRRLAPLVLALALVIGTSAAGAADSADPAEPDALAAARAELMRLKSQVETQQEQIQHQQAQLTELRKALESAQRTLDQLSAAAPQPVALTPQAPLPGTPTSEPLAPPYIRIGDAYITPVGFVDFATVFRSAAAGSGTGTNFGAIPFNTVPTARLTEVLPSAQNSRIGARVDTKVKNVRVIGYWESDFLGNNPGNVAVTSDSNTFRMRLLWVDLRKNKWEILGGQSWSMLTPNRNGISPLPADVFYGQAIDVNYLVGLPWMRTPGFRFVYHPSSTVAAGIALEEPQQYIGGSGGQGSITLPTNSNIAANYANQLNNGTTIFAVPNLLPDVIGKLAFDPKIGSLHQHIEVAGIYRTFRVFNPANNTHFTQPAGGASFNLNLEVAKDLHLIGNFFASDGGGRWLFGSGPDLIIRGNGSISPIQAYSTASGIEFTRRSTSMYAYYGADYFTRNTAIDLNGKWIGYGYPGAPDSQNRNIQEGTGGFIQTFWKNPRWGALQFMFQYAYYFRTPWYVAPDLPKNAHNSTVFVDMRYVLPGAAPNIK